MSDRQHSDFSPEIVAVCEGEGDWKRAVSFKHYNWRTTFVISDDTVLSASAYVVSSAADHIWLTRYSPLGPFHSSASKLQAGVSTCSVAGSVLAPCTVACISGLRVPDVYEMSACHAN